MTVGNVCGVAGFSPLPGDPSNNLTLSAVPAFGGVDVTWTYPATNPYAIAHVLLYRALSSNFNLAVQIAIVAGNFYYDKVLPAPSGPYFYWIKTVSINGTVGELIGPASATPRLMINDVILELSGKISASELAQSLRTEVDRIAVNYAELEDEIADRIAGDAAALSSLQQMQSNLTQAFTLINSEIVDRQDGDSALVGQLNTIAAANGNVATLIATEQSARIAGDTALASDITLLQAANTNLGAAVLDLNQSKIGYSVVRDTSLAYDGDGTTVVYPVATYPAATYPQYVNSRTRIIDKVGVTNWNATAAGIAKPLDWLVGLPLATAVKSVQVIGPDGQTSSVEAAMSAQSTLNDGLKAQYTVRLQTASGTTDKVIGGFGLYGDATGTTAGFDVDTFWIGKLNQAKKYPFIVSGDKVYIDEAVIQSLTFSKLRDESGSFIVQNGKVKANYLNVVELNAGQFTSYNWPTSGNGVHLSSLGILAGNYETGNNFLQWDSGNGTFVLGRGSASKLVFDSAGNLSITGTLTAGAVNAVNTINIAGDAVTFPRKFEGEFNASGVGPSVDVECVLDRHVVVTAYFQYGGNAAWRRLLLDNVEWVSFNAFQVQTGSTLEQGGDAKNGVFYYSQPIYNYAPITVVYAWKATKTGTVNIRMDAAPGCSYGIGIVISAKR